MEVETSCGQVEIFMPVNQQAKTGQDNYHDLQKEATWPLHSVNKEGYTGWRSFPAVSLSTSMSCDKSKGEIITNKGRTANGTNPTETSI